jgi:hypothetical protein
MISQIDLNEIAGGALKEQFEHYWEQLIESVLDENVPTKNARKLTIEITVKPNGERNYAAISIKCKTTLPSIREVDSAIVIGTVNGRPSVREYVSEQQTLGI